jgi:hypothetical protein
MQGVVADGCDTDRTPVVPTWFQDGVVGACGWQASDGDRVAEQAVAADRFAREIVRFLTDSTSARGG